MYEAEAAKAQADGDAGQAGGNDDVVDAEVVDEDDADNSDENAKGDK